MCPMCSVYPGTSTDGGSGGGDVPSSVFSGAGKGSQPLVWFSAPPPLGPRVSTNTCGFAPRPRASTSKAAYHAPKASYALRLAATALDNRMPGSANGQPWHMHVVTKAPLRPALDSGTPANSVKKSAP